MSLQVNWLVEVTLGALGLCCLVAGARGRLMFTVPTCRNCGYLLEGLQSGRCPECGADISQSPNVRSTRRVLRRAPLWAGMCLIVMSLLVPQMSTAVAAVVTGVYHLVPTSVLTDQLRWNTGWLRARAARECTRRLIVGSLGHQAVDSCAAACVTVVASGHGVADDGEQAVLDLAGQLYDRGALTTAQARTLLSRVFWYDVPSAVDAESGSRVSVFADCGIVGPSQWNRQLTRTGFGASPAFAIDIGPIQVIECTVAEREGGAGDGTEQDFGGHDTLGGRVVHETCGLAWPGTCFTPVVGVGSYIVRVAIQVVARNREGAEVYREASGYTFVLRISERAK